MQNAGPHGEMQGPTRDQGEPFERAIPQATPSPSSSNATVPSRSAVFGTEKAGR